MKKFTGAGLALLLGTTAAYAGGLDRSGQSVGAVFQSGNYVELSYGNVSPNVSGVFTHPLAGDLASGNMAESYMQLGGAYKSDINDKFALAIIMDSPFGVAVNYDTAGYPVVGSSAEVKTTSLTVLGRYKVSDNVSVYAGPRMITASGNYSRRASGVPTATYDATYASDSDVGYVVGAAYEIPDIALRASLTYSSQTEFELDGTVTASNVGATTTTLTAVMPQSINLEFQTGIAADTLLMAGVRWADWSEGTLDDSFLATPFGGSDGNLADFNNTDTYTYSIGIGRRFSEQFAASVMVSYEEAQGGLASNLSPTDGYTSIQLGGSYKVGNGVEISGGIRYVALGDATSEPLSGISPEFTDNSATAIGLKLAYNY